MTDTERTIVQAAANLLHVDGIERVKNAATLTERHIANAALLAAVNVAEYLCLTEVPF